VSRKQLVMQVCAIAAVVFHALATVLHGFYLVPLLTARRAIVDIRARTSRRTQAVSVHVDVTCVFYWRRCSISGVYQFRYVVQVNADCAEIETWYVINVLSYRYNTKVVLSLVFETTCYKCNMFTSRLTALLSYKLLLSTTNRKPSLLKQLWIDQSIWTPLYQTLSEPRFNNRYKTSHIPL